MRATIDPSMVYEALRRMGKTFITVNEVSRMLGVSTYAAGKLLAELARMGLLVRWSRKTYKIVERTVYSRQG